MTGFVEREILYECSRYFFARKSNDSAFPVNMAGQFLCHLIEGKLLGVHRKAGRVTTEKPGLPPPRARKGRNREDPRHTARSAPWLLRASGHARRNYQLTDTPCATSWGTCVGLPHQQRCRARPSRDGFGFTLDFPEAVSRQSPRPLRPLTFARGIRNSERRPGCSCDESAEAEPVISAEGKPLLGSLRRTNRPPGRGRRHNPQRRR